MCIDTILLCFKVQQAHRSLLDIPVHVRPPTFQRRTGSLPAYDLQTVTQGGFSSRMFLSVLDQKRLKPHLSRREPVAMRVPQTPHLYHQPPYSRPLAPPTLPLDRQKQEAVNPQNKQEAVSPENKQGAVSPQNKQEVVSPQNKQGAVSPQNKQGSVSPLRALPLLLHTSQQPWRRKGRERQ